MQEINSKKLKKTNLVIWAIIAVIIISVLGCIVFQTINKSEAENNTKQSDIKSTDIVSIENENIIGTWSRKNATNEYHLTFDKDNKVTLKTLDITSNESASVNSGVYIITENSITFSVEVIGKTVTENCAVTLENDSLTLTSNSENNSYFAGIYTKYKQEPTTLSATKEVTTITPTTKKTDEPPTTIIPKTEQPTQAPVKDSAQDLKQKLLNMQFDRMIGEDTPCLLTFTSEDTLKYEFGEKYTYSYTIEGNVLTLLDVYWDGNKMPLSYTITIKDDVYYNSTKCTELYLEPRANAGPIAGKWVSGL